MPIPEPTSEETEQTFINRCMEDSTMQEEYEDTDRRLGVCYSQWRRRDKSMSNIVRKSVDLKLKSDKEGSFTARIATLDVIDKDGDVTVAGAFPEGREVLVSAYDHSSWMGELPVGKATLTEKDNEVVAEGQFNLNSQSGKEHYEAVKFSGNLQQWSYGFTITESGEETRDGQEVRILKALEPYEISPVLLGAGSDTATLAIKQDKGTTYADEAETVLAAVESFAGRTKSLADLRTKEGRTLSNSNRERMQKLEKLLSEIESDLKELLDATDPDKGKALTATLQGIKEKLNYMEVIRND